MDDDEHSISEFYYPDETGEIQDEKPNSQQEIEAFLAKQRAENTVKKTRSDLNILQKYLDSINEGEKNI